MECHDGMLRQIQMLALVGMGPRDDVAEEVKLTDTQTSDTGVVVHTY
jgi:hypothetical protein